MDDTLACPICRNKLRTTNSTDLLLHRTGKISDYAERVCTRGKNHAIQFFTDLKTGEVDFLTISLNPKYSRFLEIDFVNRRCYALLFKDGVREVVGIPKMIEPDFPDLEKLKEKISMYVVFS